MIPMRQSLILLFSLAISLLLFTSGAGAFPLRREPLDNSLFLPLLQRSSAATLSYDQRKVVMDAIEARVQSQPGEDPAAEQEAMAVYIRSLPHIMGAGVASDGSVWGRFSDNRLLIVAPPRPPQSETEDARAGLSAAELPANDLPGEDMAYVLNALGSCFQSPASTIASMLQDRNYTIAQITPSVADLKQVKDAAVFYIDTHGGSGVNWTNAKTYSLWTTTPVSLDNEFAFFGDLAAGHLVYFLAAHNLAPPSSPTQCTSEWHYAITHSFVSTYMQFSPRSFVFFNGCSSMAVEASQMRQAFGQAGAATYAGWTIPVADPHAHRAGQFLFDRLLGANVYEPQAPPQRPFDLTSVLADMQNRQYDLSVYCRNLQLSCHPLLVITATLQLQMLTNDPAQQFSLLAPTIERADTDRPPCCSTTDETMRLNLHGQFGHETGQVLVAGQSLSILEWTDTLIRATLPAHGPGSAGEVVVKVRDHASNAVPLTEWRGRVRWREEYTDIYGPGPYAEVECDLHLRADFHPARADSGQDAAWPELAEIEESQDSRCTWQMGGETTWVEPSTGDVMRYVLSGSGTLSWRPPHNPLGPYLTVTSHINPTPKQLLLVVGGLDHGEWTVYENDEFHHTEEQRLRGTGPVVIAVGDDYSLLPGTSTYTWSSGPVTTTWEQMAAQYAPTDTTPARR